MQVMSLVPLSHLLVLVYFHSYFIVLSSLCYCLFFSFIFTIIGVALKICGKMFCHPMSIWNGVSTQTPACNSKVTLIVFPVSVYLLILQSEFVNQVILMQRQRHPNVFLISVSIVSCQSYFIVIYFSHKYFCTYVIAFFL
jgi:hypothetical protein